MADAMRALRDARESPPHYHHRDTETGTAGGFSAAQPRYAGLFRDGYDRETDPARDREREAAERRIQDSLDSMTASSRYAPAPAPAPSQSYGGLLSREDQEFRNHLAQQIREALPHATDADIDEAFYSLRAEEAGSLPHRETRPEPEARGAHGTGSNAHTEVRSGYDPSKDPNMMPFGGSTSGQPPPGQLQRQREAEREREQQQQYEQQQ